jgi:hypothetical protein
MIDRDTPGSLDEAHRRFSRFLRENNYPEQILWVEQEDIVWSRSQLWVRSRSTPDAWDRACQGYAIGMKNDLGVTLYAFSELPGTAIAAVILPKEEDAAQRHLIPRGGLKLSAATQKLRVRRITNRVTWFILSMRYKASSRLFWDQYLEYS